VARFWLERHQQFRRLDRLLRTGAEAALEGSVDPAELKPWLARHLQIFLWQLEDHHRVEDLHYFPAFRRVEPRLAPGFELLEGDHRALHLALGGIVEVANRVLRQDGVDRAHFAAELARFHEGEVELGRTLVRHLDDEEDLVVPLLLERGEGFLDGSA
jgi:hemerythrin-like domain-containing protein